MRVKINGKHGGAPGGSLVTVGGIEQQHRPRYYCFLGTFKKFKKIKEHLSII